MRDMTAVKLLIERWPATPLMMIGAFFSRESSSLIHCNPSKEARCNAGLRIGSKSFFVFINVLRVPVTRARYCQTFRALRQCLAAVDRLVVMRVCSRMLRGTAWPWGSNAKAVCGVQSDGRLFVPEDTT